MEKRNIIVIGASAGGFESIREIISSHPENLDAAIFIVWHMSPDIQGIMPQILNRERKLPATNARNGEQINFGHIYIAPPDHHLLVEKHIVRVTKGPKENRFRPAIDPLFRSAAISFGARVVGIILSGALDDGSAGLWAIKQQGGIAIIQDPADAQVSSMPENAIKAVSPDHVVPVTAMPELIVRLVNEEVATTAAADPDFEKRTKMEVSIAMEDNAPNRNIFSYGVPSPYTCPE